MTIHALTSPLHAVVALLGGPAMLARPITNSLDLMWAAEAGVPMQAVRHLQAHMGLTNREMSEVMSISQSTLTRRQNARSNLTRDEAEKAIQLSAVIAHGLEVFGNEPDLHRWLHAENKALGGIRPQSLLSSALGREQVREILGRIEWGIYS